MEEKNKTATWLTSLIAAIIVFTLIAFIFHQTWNVALVPALELKNQINFEQACWLTMSLFMLGAIQRLYTVKHKE
jgi:hypothetical protein